MNGQKNNSSHIDNNFNIHCLTIGINVKEDLKSAKYTYNYKLHNIPENGIQEWTDIFEYEPDQIKELNGNATDTEGEGISIKLTPEIRQCEDNSKSCLSIDLEKAPVNDGKIHFEYSCETKIEHIKNTENGCIIYWGSEKVGMTKLVIDVTLPNGVVQQRTHPSTELIENKKIRFRYNDVSPKGYYLIVVTYKKYLPSNLGLNKKLITPIIKQIINFFKQKLMFSPQVTSNSNQSQND